MLRPISPRTPPYPPAGLPLTQLAQDLARKTHRSEQPLLLGCHRIGVDVVGDDVQRRSDRGVGVAVTEQRGALYISFYLTAFPILGVRRLTEAKILRGSSALRCVFHITGRLAHVPMCPKPNLFFSTTSSLRTSSVVAGSRSFILADPS